MKNKNISASALLIGTIIGAGIFGLPFAIAQTGLVVGLIYIAIFGSLMMVLMHMYRDIIERSDDDKHMPGHARTYLGPLGGHVMAIALIGSNIGAMLAYLIGIGEFSVTLLQSSLGGSMAVYGTIFFILGSIAILGGLTIITRIEKYMVILIMAIVAFIFVVGVPEISGQNLSQINISQAAFPFGVVLFAFGGVAALPEMKKTVGKNGSLKSPINIAVTTAAMIYMIFSIAVIGISGVETSQEAMRGLIPFLGTEIIYVGAILGIVTMATSFLTLGLIIKDVLIKDYKIHPFIAWAITCLVPYALFLSGITDFIAVLSFVGSLAGGIIGILILFMFIKSRKIASQKITHPVRVPLPIIILLFILFFTATFYQIIF